MALRTYIDAGPRSLIPVPIIDCAPPPVFIHLNRQHGELGGAHLPCPTAAPMPRPLFMCKLESIPIASHVTNGCCLIAWAVPLLHQHPSQHRHIILPGRHHQSPGWTLGLNSISATLGFPPAIPISMRAPTSPSAHPLYSILGPNSPPLVSPSPSHGPLLASRDLSHFKYCGALLPSCQLHASVRPNTDIGGIQ